MPTSMEDAWLSISQRENVFQTYILDVSCYIFCYIILV